MKTRLMKIALILFTPLMFPLLVPSAFATSASWTGTSSVLWSVSGNWSGTPAQVPGIADTATFNAAAGLNTNIDLTGGVTISNLVFDTASAVPYTIGAGGAGNQTLVLNSNGVIRVTSTVVSNQLINANLNFGTTAAPANGVDAYTISNNSLTASLTLAGALTTVQTGTNVITFLGTGTNIITGNIANGSGVIQLVKGFTGGVVILGGSNFFNSVSFNGGVNAGDNGSFRLTSSNAINGAALTMNGQNGTYQTIEFANNIIITNNINTRSRNSGNAQMRNVSGTNIYSGIFTTTATGGGDTFETLGGQLTFSGGIFTTAGSARGLQLQGTGAGVITCPLTSTNVSSVTLSNSATWTLTASNSYLSGTTLNNASTLVMGNPYALGTSTVTVTGTGNPTLDIATDGSDFTNAVSAGSSTIFTIASDVKTGSVGINHTLGAFSIGSGATPLQMNITRGPNVASGSPGITTGPLTLSGGSGGTTIINPTTASITITNVTSVSSSKTLQLDGTSTGNFITGVITNGANVVSLLKANTSTWTLGGLNTYTGPTTISNGNLTVTGIISSNSVTVAGGTLAFSGSGTISNGAAVVVGSAGILDVSAASGFALGSKSTLGGSGVINGNFADSVGSQILPGGSGAIGTMTFNNNLTLAGGDTMQFNFNASSNSVIAVGGSLTPNGTVTINLAGGANALTNGNYVLFLVTNNLNGSAANFIVSGQPTPSRQSFTVAYNTATSPKQVYLQVVGSPANLTWNPTTTAWDILVTTNWLNGAINDYYFDGDNVNFTASGSGISPVLNTNVHPGSVTFNSANPYTLSGTGAINGSTGLTKTNSGTLTIQTTNGYTGVTALNGGTVSIATITNSGFASPIGAATSASGNLTFNGGTLQYTGGSGGTDHGATLNANGGTVAVTSSGTALTLGGVIAGSSGGGLIASGGGTLVLSGVNTYNGSTTISGGTTLQVGNGGATGNLGSGSTITDNSALVVNRTGTLTLTNVITGPGSIANNNTGTLVLAATNTFVGGTIINTGLVQVVTAGGLGGTPAVFNPGQITIVGGELEASTSFNISDTNSGVTVEAGTIGVDSGVTLNISNQVVSTNTLTKALPGTLILSGSNTLTGVLNVDTGTATASDGALRIASVNALGGVPTIQIRANQGPGSSTLQLDGTAGGIVVTQAFNWSGRNNFVPAIESLAGSNTWNPVSVTLNTGGNLYSINCDSGWLAIPASFPNTVPTTGRTYAFGGAGEIDIFGSLQNGSGGGLIGMLKTNSGALTYWGSQSYSGLTSVQGGTLNAADGSSFGVSATNIEIAPLSGETGVLNISNASVSAQRIIVAGITANNTAPGTGTVNQVNGGAVSASQWVTVGSGGTSGGVGTYNLINGTLNVQNTAGGTQLEVANFTGSTGTLNIGSSGILNIENNAYISMGANAGAGNGTVNQSGGTVIFYSDAASTVGGYGILYLGKATGLTANYIYNLDGGTLQVPTITSASGNSLFYLNGGTLQAAKTNAAFMSGLTAAYVSTNNATIDSYSYPVTIPQALLHDPALGATADGGLTIVSSQGSGALTLTGTNTYTGSTVINSGTLDVNGSIGSGAVVVAGGILGGSGTLKGAVDVQSGTFAPGAAIGVLTISNSLAFENGSVAQFNFGTGTNSTAVVTGAVNVNGSTTVNINYISAITAVGTYPLIQYGSLTGFASLTPPTSANPRFTFSLVNNASAKTIELVVTGNPASLVWHGDGSINGWDNSGTYQNWLNGASADYFYDGDTVLFNNSGSDTPSIDLTATVSPASVTVNSSQNYDFAGSGSIAGPGSLTKSGSGTLTNEDNNSYVGPTIINGGTLQVGAGAASGTLGSGAVTNNASLVLDRSDAVVLPSPIYGSGTLTMAGSGTVTASGSNYYTGATLLNSGITYLQNSAGLGATNGGITVASGAQLYFTAGLNIGAAPLMLNGVGDGNGALRAGGAAATTYNGAVALSGSTTMVVDGSATLNLSSTNSINGVAANANLTLAGSGTGSFSGPLALGSGGLTVSAGTWAVATNNSFTGLTALNAGTLRISDASLGQPATFTPNQITLGGGTLEAQANASFVNANAGFTLTANSTLMVDSGVTLTISNNISGANNLTKASPGTLVLTGSNAFTGSLYVDTASGTASDGITHIASTNALANIPATPGTPTIYQNNNNGGSSTLQLDGTAGNLNLPQEIRMSCRNVAVANLENLAGSNTMSGNIDINSGGGAIYFQSDANSTLNISGNIQYIGTLVGTRAYNFTGAGNQVVNGVITAGVNAGSTINVAMSGTGTLTLAGANTYTNSTSVSSGLMLVNGSILGGGGVSVSGGTLGGVGTINDTVSVGAGGTLSPGAGGIGTLTINSNLTLAGTTYIEVSKTGHANDMVTGLTSVTYGGTLFATNLSGTLTTNDSFTIFSTAAYAQNFSAITGSPGAGLAWSFNPASGVLGVVSAATPLSALKFTASPVISGTSLNISATNTGSGTVYLLSSTNVAAPISTWTPIWTNVLGGSSSFTTNVPNAVHPALPQQFYLLSNTNN
jgi:autotransporter-associated beta strand protein